MRKVSLAALAMALVSVAGCSKVVSLHPLAMPNDADMVFDPALIGTWEVNPGGEPSSTTYVIARALSENEYAFHAGNQNHFARARASSTCW